MIEMEEFDPKKTLRAQAVLKGARNTHLAVQDTREALGLIDAGTASPREVMQVAGGQRKIADVVLGDQM